MTKITQVRKRSGELEPFEPDKINKSIEQAFNTAKAKNGTNTRKISKEITDQLTKHFTTLIPTTKDISDITEEILTKKKLTAVAKAYKTYKQEQKKLIGFKTYQNIRDDIGLTQNALTVLAQRYLLKNDQGTIIETPARLFRRVAKAVAKTDALYTKGSIAKTEEAFYTMMSKLEFLPNTPTLMNAGTQLNQLSACFVLQIEDSLHGIFSTLEKMAVIHKTGGGTGFDFSTIRPTGDIVSSTKGQASGPLSFLRIYDTTTDVIKQGGRRRGANMAILRADHPDILNFATSKTKPDSLTNFNISIAATDDFMEAVQKNKEYPLINPRTKKATGHHNAKDVFDKITNAAWTTGDPGMIFIDEINRHNPTPALGRIESTNPCGEQPLLPNESCVLGSINLNKMFKNNKFDWDKLKKTIRTATHFLDNIVDTQTYPYPEIEAITKANRKIGLGIMGFAECLIKQNIPYNSDKAVEFADKLMKYIKTEAHKKSQELGKERGSFPNFPKSTHAKTYKTMRNATVTTIAPTGTISIIAGTSSGIEPLFGIAYIRNIMEGTRLLEVNTQFEETAKEQNFYSKSLIMKIAKQGSIQPIKEIPTAIKKLFVTSYDITPEWHVKIQAAFQKHTDNAVSKTINLPETAKPEDIRKIYLLAHKLKCKGITIYRTNSKPQQVLTIAKPEDLLTAHHAYSGGCPTIECPN